MKRFAFSSIVIALFSVITVAAHSRALDPLRPDEAAKRAEELRPLAWQGQALERREGKVGSCPQYRVAIQVGDPKSKTSRTQDIFVVRPNERENPNPVPVMIIVPTINGYNAAEEKYASNLCALGIASIIADAQDKSSDGPVPSWGLEDVRTRYAVLALRTVIDYAKTNSHFIHDKVGMIGSSLGGITAALVAGLESDRLAAIITVVGGGNLPFILATSNNKAVASWREARMEADGMTTVEEYENKLRQTLRYDPMFFSSRANGKNLLMVISNNDDKVPTEVQWDLHRAFGEPEKSVFSLGHAPTIVSLAWIYFDTVSNFLQEKMQLPKFHDLFTPSQIPEDVLNELQCRM